MHSAKKGKYIIMNLLKTSYLIDLRKQIWYAFITKALTVYAVGVFVF